MKNAVAVAAAAAGGGGGGVGVGVGVVVGVVAVVVVVVVVLVVVVVSFWRQQQSLNLDRPLNQSLTRPMCMIHHLKYLMLELLESNLKQILSQKVSELQPLFQDGHQTEFFSSLHRCTPFCDLHAVVLSKRYCIACFCNCAVVAGRGP